jgi:hypothetical protein
MLVAKKPWVAEATGEGKASGVLVASAVGVGRDVFVADGTNAVWVRKKEADSVPMLWVRMALTSGVGGAGGWPAQDPSSTAASRTKVSILPDRFIFTSMVRYWRFPAFNFLRIIFTNCLFPGIINRFSSNGTWVSNKTSDQTQTGLP